MTQVMKSLRGDDEDAFFSDGRHQRRILSAGRQAGKYAAASLRRMTGIVDPPDEWSFLRLGRLKN
jgi:hypothetical protein